MGALTVVGAVPAQAFPTGDTVYIQASDGSGLEFNAFGCHTDTVVVLYAHDTSCDNGHNEIFEFYKLSDGYDIAFASYAGHYECLNVYGSNYANYTKIYAWTCDTLSSATHNEQFRQPENTFDPHYSGLWWIIPGYQPNQNQYCLNADGGIGSGHNIILYDCNSQANEAWTFTYS